MEILGKIRNVTDALEISRAMDYQKVVHSSYAPQRLEKWGRLGSNLQSLKNGQHKVLTAPEPHPRLAALGDRFLPGWHSLLRCAGVQPNSDTNIDWHRDHGAFTPWAVMLNLGEALFVEEDPKGSLSVQVEDYDLKTGRRLQRVIHASQYKLENGMVVRFNSDILPHQI